MSFNAFKEALKSCKTYSTSSQLSSSSSSSSTSYQRFDPSNVSRKPPKSSLSRQLLRLKEDTDFFPQNQLKSLKPEPNLNPTSEDDREKDEKGNEKIELKNPKLESLRQFDITGPYEPLDLSLPGDIPVVQVILGVPFH